MFTNGILLKNFLNFSKCICFFHLQVGFLPDKEANSLFINNGVDRSEFGEKCHFKFASQEWDKFGANSKFSKPYRFQFNEQNGRPSISYIFFKSGSLEMSCGSNDRPVVNITTTTAAPTTTTTPVTSPPLAGATCQPFIEVNDNGPGQQSGIIRITTTKTMPN